MSQDESNLKLLTELFDGISSLEELTRRLEPPAERELVKRVAVLRNFDATVFDQFLSKNLPGGDAITFDKFVASFKVEPVPRTFNSFRIKDEARPLYIEDLWSDREAGGDAFRAEETVFQNLLDYYETKGPEADLDRLALLAIVSPKKAQEELERLYTEADVRFDLPRCDDLLRTFEVRTRLLSDELKNFCRSKRQYHNSRSLYIADYYQTNTYLGRANMAQDFARFVAPSTAQDQEWIFHVYATGGMGKTMFVRWLISRHCVPEPHRIPVARLDFDLMNLNYISRHPLLLLLPIAEQLNEQIDQRPFTEPLASFWRFRPLLDPPTSADVANRFDLESDFQSIESSWRLTALKVFSRTLKEAKFDKPIVIALDTLEEMLLLNRDGLVKVIQQIEEIHGSYPALRLVLSGRYDLSEQLKELAQVFDKHTVECELKRFNTAEARAYLTENRGLKDEPLIEAIIEKCADNKERTINPFILSLMTDLVSSRDIETPEEVRKYPRAEVAYMIQRIIERIKDPDVRWMLRYAVVPRILTLEVVENVMWGHLLKERGKRGKDLSLQCADDEGFDQRDYWPYGDAATAAEAWDKLKPLVSQYGWVSFDQKDASRLRLHPEVVVPMRFLLAKEEIFSLLHKEAAQYFVKKANEQSNEWAPWMCEAVYHHFQVEGPKAESFWRRQLGAKQVKTDMEARRQLAFEITQRDYVDEDETPLKWPHEESETGIVTHRALCEAHHEVVVTSIMLAARNKQKTEGYATEWDTARQHLVKLDALLKADVEPGFEPSFDVELYMRLATQLNKSLIDYDVVIPLIESALLSTRGIFLPLGLKIQLAEMYESTNSTLAEKYFKEAHEESRFLRIPYLSPGRIKLKLARWYHDQKRFKEALAEYEEALADAKRRDASPAVRKINYQLAEVNREIGLYSVAENLSRQLLESNQLTNTPERFDYELWFNNLQARELYRPLTALRATDAFSETADNPRKQAAVAELKGFALGQLMEFKDAPLILEQAKELWNRVVDPIGPDRTRLQRVELHLDQVGNVNDTTALLDSWATQSERKSPEITIQMELLKVRCLYLQDEREAASKKWLTLLDREEVTSSTRSLVRVLSAGLAFSLGGPETLASLLGVLGKIEPPSARLPLLTAFRFADQNGEADRIPEYNKLIKLIGWPVEKREAFSSTVIFADLLRFCRSDPGDLLARALSRSLEQAEHFAYTQLLSACNRAGIRSDAEGDLSPFLEEYGQYRSLCFAVLLERAQRELENEELEACEQTLAVARDQYSQSDITTKWSALSRELAGRLEQRRGDEDKAAAHLTAAASIYERLGDKRSAGRIKSLVAAPRETISPGPAPVGSRQGTYSLRLETLENSIAVTSEIITVNDQQNWKRSQNTKVTRRFPQSEFSSQLTAPLRDRAANFELTRRMTEDFEGFRRALGELLFSSQEMEMLVHRGRESEPRLDARLELPATAAKIPIELALVEGDTALPDLFRYLYRGTSNDLGQTELIKWIQVATNALTGNQLVVDGLIGSGTTSLLTSLGIPGVQTTMDQIRERLEAHLREQKGHGRVKALIISPSFETQIAAQRGHDVGGLSLRYLYEDLGFNCINIDVRRPERLADEMEKAIATFNPQFVHIESSFTENPSSGQVYLNFNVERDSHGSQSVDYASESASDYLQLSTTLLNDALFKSSKSRLRPLLILEAQRAPGDSATIQQMLLRNTFAAELFRLGNTSGVIASGLFEHVKYRTPLLRLLAEGLAERASLGKAVSRMNQLSHEMAARKGLLLVQSPILFTDNPSFTLLPMD